MSLQGLKQAIFSEADKRIEAIRNEHAALQKREQNRIQLRAKKMEEEIIAAAQRQAATEAAKIHQAARLQAKAEILKAKQKELDKIKEQVIEELQSKDDKMVAEVMEALMTQLDDKSGTVVPTKKHHDLIHRLAKKHHLKVAADSRAGEGGFIYRTSDGEVNLTVRHLVDQVFFHHRAAIAKTLFAA